MNTESNHTSPRGHSRTEFVTFRIGDALIGVDICAVEEINRHIDVTPVPHAPDNVRGVINLRGEVVTVIDLRTSLGMPATELNERTRAVVVRSRGERIGLLVDSITGVVEGKSEDMSAPPANVGGIEGRFFAGVHKLREELLIVLDIDAVLSGDIVAGRT